MPQRIGFKGSRIQGVEKPSDTVMQSTGHNPTLPPLILRGGIKPDDINLLSGIKPLLG
jgi:hypothetical protein